MTDLLDQLDAAIAEQRRKLDALVSARAILGGECASARRRRLPRRRPRRARPPPAGNACQVCGKPVAGKRTTCSAECLSRRKAEGGRQSAGKPRGANRKPASDDDAEAPGEPAPAPPPPPVSIVTERDRARFGAPEPTDEAEPTEVTPPPSLERERMPMRRRLPAVPVDALRKLVQAEFAESGEAGPRPRVRGDCLPGGPNADRPCPWAGCRYHLGLQVTEIGSLQVFEGWEDDGGPSCALDVAEHGEAHTLDEVGALLGVTRERARQEEVAALRAVQAAGGASSWR